MIHNHESPFKVKIMRLNKHKHSWISNSIIALFLLLLLVTCEKEPDKPTGGSKIKVSVTSIEAISYSFGDIKATISGLDSNKVNITNHGFCWSTTPDPDLNSSIIELGQRNEFGSFTTRLSGLDENKKYYVRAFVSIPSRNILGPSTEFTTLERGLAVVTIDSINSIAVNSACCFSSVLSDGGYDVTARGVCWDTTGNPTLQKCINFTTNGNGTGPFISDITGLTPSTTYFVRAYATNISGTAYGNQISFTTSAPVAVVFMNEIYSRGTIENPDWIEIYNTSTTVAADISGFKIYDNGGQAGTKPKKEFPAGTVIQPGGFFVIVVDGDDASGFGLSSGGEQVWLENATGTIIDDITFPALAETESYGRYPDGTANLQILSILTPGAANDNSTPPPAATQVTGTARFPAGVSGDLSNAKVSLYTSYDNWLYNQPIKYGAVTGSGATVSFTLTNVIPGNYYLDVWKDIDNSATWTSGDYVGWYGSGGLGSPQLIEFQISQGQTFSCSVDMYIIAKSAMSPKLNK